MCSRCGKIKSVDHFGKIKSSPDGKRNTCKECRQEAYLQDRERIMKKSKKWYDSNKEYAKKKSREYKIQNREWYREYDKQYYLENKEEINNRVKEAFYQRMENDKGFLILQRLRKRMWDAMKGRTRSKRTAELVGCSTDKLLLHIEKQFTEGMAWENYGEWHLDHILPCSIFDFEKEEHQKICFNYKNLQPLWAEDNFAKSNKLDWKGVKNGTF